MHLSQPLEVLIQNQANYQPSQKFSSRGEAFADFAQHIEMTNIKTLKQKFPTMSLKYENDEMFKMLLKKGVFPYAWFDNLNKLTRKNILSKEDFYNDLTKEHISDEEYQHYLNVMKTLQLNDFQEYLELYLKTDVLQLADVCNSYRQLGIKHYDLDPFHFVSAPSMAWQAALKKTGVKLELITDVDQYNFVSRGIRGGVSYIAAKHAKANNKDMGDLYDEDKQSSYISDIDMNNLYAWAMMESLPVGDFKWVEPPKAPNLYVPTKTFNYFYEVDMKYPEKLHDDHPVLVLKLLGTDVEDGQGLIVAGGHLVTDQLEPPVETSLRRQGLGGREVQGEEVPVPLGDEVRLQLGKFHAKMWVVSGNLDVVLGEDAVDREVHAELTEFGDVLPL